MIEIFLKLNSEAFIIFFLHTENSFYTIWCFRLSIINLSRHSIRTSIRQLFSSEKWQLHSCILILINNCYFPTIKRHLITECSFFWEIRSCWDKLDFSSLLLKFRCVTISGTISLSLSSSNVRIVRCSIFAWVEI